MSCHRNPLIRYQNNFIYLCVCEKFKVEKRVNSKSRRSADLIPSPPEYQMFVWILRGTCGFRVSSRSSVNGLTGTQTDRLPEIFYVTHLHFAQRVDKRVSRPLERNVRTPFSKVWDMYAIACFDLINLLVTPTPYRIS